MINKFVFSYNESFSITLNPLFIQDSSNSVSGTIDWGDGSTSSYAYATASHTYNSGGTYTVTYNTQGSTKIGNGFCANNGCLISCELSDELTNICAGTFYGASNLKELNIPYMCIVEDNSCSYSGLEVVNFGSPDKKSIVNYTSNGTNAFYMCSSLKNINYYYKLSISDNKIYTYFYKTSNSYHIIKFETEIRNIRIGSHMPSFRNIDVERESKTIWKIALGSKIIWNIYPDTSSVEFLKVSENYIGEKFLESYNTQSVLTSVYWIHEVDGAIIETYLSTSELQSWECETLEPYYYTDGDRQYVGYYQIPVGTDFGQHDMKITYKSPDTGNVLKLEYPIYYLEEVELQLEQTEYDWYPFRGLWAESSEECLPCGNLKYKCLDNNGIEIVDYLKRELTFFTTKYTFPIISNAQYKLGENQSVHGSYISDCHKCYDFNITVNIRKYTDERNPNKNGNSTYYHKEVVPYSFTINYTSNVQTYQKFVDRHLFLFPPYSINNIDIKISNSINVNESDFNTSSVFSTDDYDNGYDTFATTFYNTLCNTSTGGTFSNFSSKDEFINYLKNCKFNEENLLEDVVVKGVNISSMLPTTNVSVATTSYLGNYNSKKIPSVSSFGYVFWGDGTFDRHTFSNKIILEYFDEYDYTESEKISVYKYGTISSTTSTFTVLNIDDTKLRNGSVISNDEIVSNFENNTIFKNRYLHSYKDDGQYTIEITTPAGMDIGETSPSMDFTDRTNFWRFDLNCQSSNDINTSYSFLDNNDYEFAKNDITGSFLQKENFILTDLIQTDYNGYVQASSITKEMQIGTSLGYRRCYGYRGKSLNSGYETYTSIFGFRLCGIPFLEKINFNSKMFNSYSTLTSSSIAYKFNSMLKYLQRLTEITVDLDYSKNIKYYIPELSKFTYNNGGLKQYYGGNEIFNKISHDSLSNIVYSYESSNGNVSIVVYNNDTIKLSLNDGYTTLQAIENKSNSLPDDPHELDIWINN